ncbi:MAG TPA: hypothetical protein ENG45_01055, partial [Candidatus Aenigmarchaeota archaeon]|nr:hypothetical protein [Candidatus Aenigmarchaeota archaeon]
MNRKAFVVGLDGATFDIIIPLVKNGKLPTFSYIMKNGTWGRLKSTIPPVSAPAWVSFATGVNPGKHGIFDFKKWDREEYCKSEIVSSYDVRAPRIWEILELYGKKCGVVNLPLTYPPQRIDGFMISGMLTPPSSENFTYPPELKEELEDYKIDIEFGKYGFIPSFGLLKKSKMYRELISIERIRLKNVLKLMKREWDLFIVVFRHLDSAQHVFWGDKKLIEGVYREADHILASILERLENTNVFVVSDHGFEEKANKDFHLNDWLIKNGYMKLKPEFRKPFINKRTLNVLKKLKILDIIWSVLPKKESFVYEYKHVDWTKTKAYFSPKHFAFPWIGVEINVKGVKKNGIVSSKEYEKLREEIIERVSKVTDPQTGECIVEGVFKREDIYKGEFVEDAPDIIIKFKFPYRGEKSVGNRSLISPSLKTNIKGEHELYGIFLAIGPDIE